MSRRTPPPFEDDDTRAFVAEMHEQRHQGSGFGPELAAGDPDARWDEAESSGEETACGSETTPDQNVVSEIGAAIGVSYDDGEPLKIGVKETSRDEHRWELDPASADDYRERGRSSESGLSDPLLSMSHAGHAPHREKAGGVTPEAAAPSNEKATPPRAVQTDGDVAAVAKGKRT